MNLAIYCAGNLGREIYDMALRINDVCNRWKRIFFLDDIYTGNKYYGVDVYRIEKLPVNFDEVEFTIANGTPAHRANIFDKLKKFGAPLAIMIDPTVVVSSSVSPPQGQLCLKMLKYLQMRI